MFLVMPIVALVLVKYFEFHHAIEVALIALALSPVPPLVIKKESKAGGHGSHALGLMVTMAVLSILIVPLGVGLVGPVFDLSLSVSPAAIAKVITKSVLLPIALGMLVRVLFPTAAERMARPATMVGIGVLGIASLLILGARLPALRAQLGDGTLLSLACFVLVGLVAGHWLGGPDPRDRAVLALSTASRHPGIALAIASLSFPGDSGLASAVLLYLVVNLFVSVPYVHWQRARLVHANLRSDRSHAEAE